MQWRGWDHNSCVRRAGLKVGWDGATKVFGTAMHGAAGGEGDTVCPETFQSIRVGCSRAGDSEGLCSWWHEKAHKRALSSIICCSSAQAPSAVLASDEFEIRCARSESEINKLHQLGSSSCLKQEVIAADEHLQVGEMN